MGIYQYTQNIRPQNIGQNALSGAQSVSALKTANMQRDKQQRSFDKEDAATKLRENALNKETNISNKAELEDTGEIKEGVQKEPVEPLEELSQEEENKHNALAPEVKQAQVKAQKQEMFRQAIEKRMIMQNIPPEQAKALSQGTLKEIQDLETWVKTANDNEKTMKAAEINDINTKVMQVLSLPPEEQQAAYTQGVKELDADISMAVNNGNKEEALRLQEIKNTLPAEFSPQWGQDYIMTQSQKFQILKEDFVNKNKEKAAIAKDTRGEPKVLTQGDEDILYERDPNTGKMVEKERSESNALRKSKASGKGSGGDFEKNSPANYFMKRAAEQMGLKFDTITNTIEGITKGNKGPLNELQTKSSEYYTDAKNKGKPITREKAFDLALKKLKMISTKEEQESENIKNNPSDGDVEYVNGEAVKYYDGESQTWKKL